MSSKHVISRSGVLVALTFLFAVHLTSAASNGADIAIVVRPDVPVDNLTFIELRKLMLGNKQFWTPSLRVTLLIRAPGAPEREVVLKTIYRLSEPQFQQYWIAK